MLTAVTGRSGVGKTTLLERSPGSQTRLGPDRSGRSIARRLGRRAAGRTAARADWRTCPQEPAPIGLLTRRGVTLALSLRDGPAFEATERADAALTLVSLADRARQRVSRLSAGESQRVALAAALACARGLLIVDEPTSRLDEDNATTVAALCEAAAEGQTVICATHDPAVISQADQSSSWPDS